MSPSTDIDGSPIMICNKKEGEIIVDLLRDAIAYRLDLSADEEKLAAKLHEAFGLLV